VAAIPFGLFIVWWLVKAGDGSSLHVQDWPPWILTMIAGTAEALLGHTPGSAVSAWGAAIAVLTIAAVAIEIGPRREIERSLATGLMLPIAFIALATFGRGGRFDPVASRYTYTLFVLALLALAEVFRGRRLETAGTLVFVAPLVAFSLAANLVVMSQGASGLRFGAQQDREYATATLLVGKSVADKVSSNKADTLFTPGDTPALSRWISQPAHRKYAMSEAELAADPGAKAAVDAMETQLRAEAAKAQP
jgi:hypothetical protein